MSEHHGSQRVVVAALFANLAIAACKFVAAGLSGSAAMLAEALHSIADTGNQVFLLVGIRRSMRPADEDHPFGHGLETYFWAFIVALCIFLVGGAFSIVEGVKKVLHPPTELGSLKWAYIVLGASIVLESYSFVVALREFRRASRGRGLRRTWREARDPTVLTVLFEDSAALFGLVVAAIGITLAHLTGNLIWDGVASIVVGLALVSVAYALGGAAKALLMGKSVPDEERRRILEIARSAEGVSAVVHIRTIHFGPQDAMCGLKLTFAPGLDTRALEQRINTLEAKLRAELPHLRRIYVEPGFDEHPPAIAEPKG